MTTPTPRQMLAVFLGSGSFPWAPDLERRGRAFYNSAQDFRDYLVSPAFGLPRQNIEWLFEDSRSPSDQLLDLSNFIRAHVANPPDSDSPPQDIVVFYVGHGLFTQPDQAYCLAVRATQQNREGLTSIRVSDLAAVIKDSARFLRRYLFLDCCFSAAAYKEFQAGPLEVARVRLLEELPKRGTALLCSSSAHDASLAPEGQSRTMFSDALLKTLHDGHEALGPTLSINELGDLIKANLEAKYRDAWVRPEVHSPDQREGEIAAIGLFPNPAHLKKAAEDKAAEQRRTAKEGARRKQGEAVARDQRLREIAAQERAASERAAAEREAARKAEAERLEKQKEERERRARDEGSHLAREKAEQERLAAERAEAERIVRRKMEQEHAAAENFAAANTFGQTVSSTPSSARQLLLVGLILAVGGGLVWLMFLRGSQNSDKVPMAVNGKAPSASGAAIKTASSEAISPKPTWSNAIWKELSIPQGGLELELVQSLKPPDNNQQVLAVAFSPDGRLLASASTDPPWRTGSGNGSIQLWNFERGTLVSRFARPGDNRPEDQLCSLAFSPDSQLIAASTCNIPIKPNDARSVVQIWEVSTGKLVNTLQGKDMIRQIAFNPVSGPNGHTLASVSDEGLIRLWNPISAAVIREWKYPNEIVASVAFSPDGRMVAAGDYHKTVHLWDTTSGKLLRGLVGNPRSDVDALAFSPNGEILASGHYYGNIHLWNLATGTSILNLAHPDNGVEGLAYSPDGRVLGSINRASVRLWNPNTGDLLAGADNSAEGSSGGSISFHPTHALLATSGVATASVWLVKRALK